MSFKEKISVIIDVDAKNANTGFAGKGLVPDERRVAGRAVESVGRF